MFNTKIVPLSYMNSILLAFLHNHTAAHQNFRYICHSTDNAKIVLQSWL